MKNRTLLIEILISASVLMLLAAGAWFFTRKGARAWPMDSASISRSEAEKDWIAVINPPPASSVGPITYSSMTSKSDSTSPNDIMTIPAERPSPYPRYVKPEDFVIEHAVAGQQIHLGEGIFALQAVAVNHRESSNAGAQQVFDADGKPAESEIAALMRGTTPSFEGEPGADYEFSFTAPGIEHFALIGFDVYDSGTHWKVSGGAWETHASGSALSATTRIAMDRPAPVELILNLAWGDPKSIERPAVEREEFLFNPPFLSILFLGPGKGIRQNGKGDASLQFDPGAKGGTSALLTMLANAGANFAIDGIDDAGHIHPAGAYRASGNNLMVQFDAPPNRLSKLRVASYPHVTRIRVSLPELYGAPEVNRGASNLMDVQIPYLKINNEHAWRRAVEGYLQLNLEDATGGTTPGEFEMPAKLPHFPIEITNISVGDFVREFESHLKRHELHIDETKGAAQITYSPPTWLDRLLEMFGLS